MQRECTYNSEINWLSIKYTKFNLYNMLEKIFILYCFIELHLRSTGSWFLV